jgi:enoyl-CoA hydratase/carnithine racemase
MPEAPHRSSLQGVAVKEIEDREVDEVENAESQSSREPYVLAERRGAVLLLTLNRPDRLNAWNDALEREYFEQLDGAEDDPGVRAIVVTGAGRGFCAGADLADIADASEGDSDDEWANRARPRSRPLELRKPLIAAINGPAVGLGLVEALYCDLRFSTPEAKLGTAFAIRGLIAEYGAAYLLPRIVGLSRALDLLYSGRIILGEEALRIGLVDRLVAREKVVDAAVEYADTLARLSSPTSMATIKRQVWSDLDRDWNAAFEDSEELLRDSFNREDVAEGVASYNERREPRFQPLEPRQTADGS